MFLHPLLPRWGDLLLLEVSFSGDQGNVAPKACWAVQGWGSMPHRYPGPSPEPSISDTLVNSVCPKQPVLAGCPTMECQSIDQVWHWSCAGLGAHSGQSVAAPWRVRLGPALVDVAPVPPCGGMHQPKLMGLLRVKDTATPEVKFLDRCMIHCGEGVWQGPVRRSRMRAWGAKMIRHRRSPEL